MSWDQRRAERPLRPPWWALPTKNTLYRATATFPKLLHERLDQTGIDFAVLYPTAGLGAPHIMPRERDLDQVAIKTIRTLAIDAIEKANSRSVARFDRTVVWLMAAEAYAMSANEAACDSGNP